MWTINPEAAKTLATITFLLSVAFLVTVPTFIALIWLELRGMRRDAGIRDIRRQFESEGKPRS